MTFNVWCLWHSRNSFQKPQTIATGPRMGGRIRNNQQYAQQMANSTDWQGRIAPDFELKTTRGERFQLSENVGKKIIVLNFFAT
jgi:hypothetical protein